MINNNDDNEYFSDHEHELLYDNTSIYDEDLYQFKINEILKFKSLIYHEPEFIGIYNISSQKILDIIEDTIYNNKFNKFRYNPTLDQFESFKNIYITIIETMNINEYKNINENIICIINKIYSKLYI